MKVSFFFAWYDFWVGFFYDQKKRVLYICPLPCCVIKVELQPLPRIAADICVRCGAFLLADDVTLHKCNDRRFTQLLDADGRPIFEGDLLSVGMRVGDASGWTADCSMSWRHGGTMRELWAYDEPHFSGGNCQVTMTREQAIAMQRRQYPYETDEAAFDDWQSVNWAYPVSDTSSRATVTAKPFTPDWSLLRATQASLREHMAALKAAQEPERAFREQVAAAMEELRASIAAESVDLTPENAAGYSRDIADAENATVELALHHVDATIAALGLGGTEETR